MPAYFPEPTSRFSQLLLRWGWVLVVLLAAPCWAIVVGGDDALAYIRMGEHALAGQWADFWNGYWSPLQGLLLAVPLWAGVSPEWASTVVAGVGAGAFAAACWPVLRDAHIKHTATIAVFGSLLTVFLYAMVNSGHTPDLLANALVVVCLRTAAHRWQPRSNAGWLVLGLAMAGAAWAKAAWVYVLPGAIVVVCAVHWFTRRQQPTSKLYPGMRATLLVLVGWSVPLLLWQGLRHHTTGNWGFSTAGEYNFRLSYEWNGVHPSNRAGLLPPSQAGRFPWENIVQYDFGSPKYTSATVLKGIEHNAKRVFWSSIALGWAIPLLLSAGLLCWHRKRIQHLWRSPLLSLTAAVIAALVAYSVVYYELRYISLVFPVSWALCIAVFSALWNDRRAVIGLSVVAGTSVGVAVFMHLLWGSLGYYTGRYLAETRTETEALLRLLQPVPNARWASATSVSTYIPYTAGGYYFGIVKGNEPYHWREQLEQDSIRYFVSTKEEPIVGFEGHYERVSTHGMSVYMLY